MCPKIFFWPKTTSNKFLLVSPNQKKWQKKVSKKYFKCAETKKMCQKKGSNLISPPIFRFDPQFQGLTHVMSQGLLLYDNYCSFIDEISPKMRLKINFFGSLNIWIEGKKRKKKTYFYIWLLMCSQKYRMMIEISTSENLLHSQIWLNLSRDDDYFLYIFLWMITTNKNSYKKYLW